MTHNQAKQRILKAGGVISDKVRRHDGCDYDEHEAYLNGRVFRWTVKDNGSVGYATVADFPVEPATLEEWQNGARRPCERGIWFRPFSKAVAYALKTPHRDPATVEFYESDLFTHHFAAGAETYEELIAAFEGMAARLRELRAAGVELDASASEDSRWKFTTENPELAKRFGFDVAEEYEDEMAFADDFDPEDN